MPRTYQLPIRAQTEWTLEMLSDLEEVLDQAADTLGFDRYPTRTEIIRSEQMLDAYASIGLPHMYPHWSFGKRFAQQEAMYRKGATSLALEMIVNSKPAVCYLMEENSAAAQAMVLAHAAVGHNHFFKANQTFQEWSDADSILDYAEFARNYVRQCEERYGVKAVERVLDAAHSLQEQGVNRTPARHRLTPAEEQRRIAERFRHRREDEHELWRVTVPHDEEQDEDYDLEKDAQERALALPEENVLYFIEKNSPALKEWQRELIHIVRTLSAYFEPQRQTKMMNEGCACWCHYRLMHQLRDEGYLDEGAMLEFLHLHSSVVAQASYKHPAFSRMGINPYALGFEMMRDIERICTEPTDEDREWFPAIAGNEEPVETLKWAWREFRDESFIRQFLSPRLIRHFKLFLGEDDTEKDFIEVKAIHDEAGYRDVRSALADQHDVVSSMPDIQVVSADLDGDRELSLAHMIRNGQLLEKDDMRRTVEYAHRLWGYPVALTSEFPDAGEYKTCRSRGTG